MKADEYRELDDERVLVLHQWSGRGKRSGLEVAQMQTNAATILHIRDGKVTKFVSCWDADRALADLGLSSEATTADSWSRCRIARNGEATRTS